jgi:hypothetical protein
MKTFQKEDVLLGMLQQIYRKFKAFHFSKLINERPGETTKKMDLDRQLSPLPSLEAMVWFQSLLSRSVLRVDVMCGVCDGDVLSGQRLACVMV